MNNTMHYKGYVGSVEYDEEDQLFFGKVQGIKALVSYEGTNAAELTTDFHAAVDGYLALCEGKGVMPEVAYKGSFNVRIAPELHRKFAEYAIQHKTTLNKIVEAALTQYAPVLTA